MFGLSWTQILVIVVIGVFLLGPERIPVAVQWLTSSLRKARSMAQGAQEQLNSELGPEIAEMRRQIQELQSLKELQELKQLRDLHPKNLLGKGLLGEGQGTAGGVAGFLGLDKDLLSAPKPDEKPQSPNGPAEAVAAHQEQLATAADTTPNMTKDPAATGATTPPVMTKPAADPLPVADPLPTVDPLPAVDPSPAADPLPAADALPVGDPIPAVAPAAAPAEPATATEAVPTAEAVPTVEPVPAVEPTADIEPERPDVVAVPFDPDGT